MHACAGRESDARAHGCCRCCCERFLQHARTASAAVPADETLRLLCPPCCPCGAVATLLLLPHTPGAATRRALPCRVDARARRRHARARPALDAAGQRRHCCRQGLRSFRGRHARGCVDQGRQRRRLCGPGVCGRMHHTCMRRPGASWVGKLQQQALGLHEPLTRRLAASLPPVMPSCLQPSFALLCWRVMPCVRAWRARRMRAGVAWHGGVSRLP